MSHLWFRLSFIAAFTSLALLSWFKSLLLGLLSILLTVARWLWNALVLVVTFTVWLSWLCFLVGTVWGVILVWKFRPDLFYWPAGIAGLCLIEKRLPLVAQALQAKDSS